MELGCMEDGRCGEIPLCRAQRDENLMKLVFLRDKQLLRLYRFTVAGLLLVVTVGFVLASLIIFGYQRNSARCQHVPSADDDHFSEANAQQQQQEKKQVKNPSALLTALQSSSSTEYLEWNDKREDARLEGGFTYSNGYLVVPRDGYYKVYLQITYWSPGDPFCEKDEQMLTLRHGVYRFETAYPEYRALLFSHDTVSCSMPVWRKSMYTAAVFNLTATDRLRVQSMHPQLMSRRAGELFFGADLVPR